MLWQQRYECESAPATLLLATSTLCNATIAFEFGYMLQPISEEIYHRQIT